MATTITITITIIVLAIIFCVSVMILLRGECDHPHKSLVVFSDSTDVEIEHHSGSNHKEITHHLMCRKCNERVDVGYVKLDNSIAALQ